MAGERDIVTGVIQLANLLTRRMAPLFEKAKITPQQWSVLSVIADHDAGASLVGLSRRLSVTKQNMTGMIARLEQLGLAERQDDPNDLRSSRVLLTRRGRSLVEKVRPAYQEWVRDLAADDVTTRDLEALGRTVEKLIARLEA